MSKLLKKAAWYVQEMTASNKTSTVPLTSLPRGQNSLSDSRPAIRTRFLSRDLQQSLSLKAQRRRREGAVTRLSVRPPEEEEEAAELPLSSRWQRRNTHADLTCGGLFVKDSHNVWVVLKSF